MIFDNRDIFSHIIESLYLSEISKMRQISKRILNYIYLYKKPFYMRINKNVKEIYYTDFIGVNENRFMYYQNIFSNVKLIIRRKYYSDYVLCHTNKNLIY